MTSPRIGRGTSDAGVVAWARRILITLVVLLFVSSPIAARLADWLGYREVGFERVFVTMIVAQWVMGLVAGVSALVVLYTSSRVALRGVATRNLHIKDAQAWAQEGPKVLLERMATWLAPVVSLVIAVIAGLASSSYWRDLAMYFYRSPFGVTDPVFQRDIAYYVFTLPMLGNVSTF